MTSITNVSRWAPDALAASLIFALTGCGGAGTPVSEGIYYTEGIINSGGLGRLVVDGSTLGHHDYSCEGVNDRPGVRIPSRDQHSGQPYGGPLTQEETSVVPLTLTVDGEEVRVQDRYFEAVEDAHATNT